MHKKFLLGNIINLKFSYLLVFLISVIILETLVIALELDVVKKNAYLSYFSSFKYVIISFC